jgi:hypothetical protein
MKVPTGNENLVQAEEAAILLKHSHTHAKQIEYRKLISIKQEIQIIR